MLRKLVVSLICLLLSLGYLSALVNLYLTHEYDDLKPGLGVSDVMTNFHGNPAVTRLTYMINHDMRQYLADSAQKSFIETWVAGGAGQKEYQDHIKPIFDAQCIKCHSMFGEADFTPLTTFEETRKVTVPYPGKSWQQIARLSHQHFFGMTFIVCVTGWLMIRSKWRLQIKYWLIFIGCTGILMDVGGWWLTRLNAAFACLVITGNALHSAVFGLSVMMILFETWVMPQSETSKKG